MPVKTKWAGYVRANIRSFDVRTTSQGEAQNASIKSDHGVKADIIQFCTRLDQKLVYD